LPFYITLSPTKDDKYQRIPCESDYEVSSLVMQCLFLDTLAYAMFSQ